MIEDLDHLVEVAVKEVFGTMLNFHVVRDLSGAAPLNGEAHVAGSVGFTGRAIGVIYIYAATTFARQITGVLLGLNEKEVAGDEMVNDAIGEITNMVVGHLKSRLSDRGIPCVLTIPSIVRGTHFRIESISNTQRGLALFRCQKNQFVVETLIKPST
ncbi:MAG: chemotaxis protein CheX [Verrucomicrobiota bacterium]